MKLIINQERFDFRDSETKKPDEYCLKIDKLQKKINVRTKNIQIIFLVQMNMIIILMNIL